MHLVIFTLALSGLLIGFSTGINSGATIFIAQDFQLTSFDIILLISTILFGAFVGAIISGRLADYYGRRTLMIINALLFLLGTLISSFVTTFPWLITSRIIVGFAIGTTSYAAPIYIAELAPFNKRGILAGFYQLFICLGILLAYGISYIFAFGGHWRLMFSIGAAPAIMLLIALLFTPETPQWLFLNNQDQKARDVLQTIHPTTDIEPELLQIKETLNEQRNDWRMLFQPWLLPAVIVAFGLATFQQLVGINIFLYYSPLILVYGEGDPTTVAMLATFGIGLLLVIFTLVALPLIDRWGRRPLLLLGSIGMTLGMLIFSTVFLWIPKQTPMSFWSVIIGTIIYIASFAMSFGPISWLMISEIFPLRVRGLATSLATATIWGINMLVIFTFVPIVKLIHLSGTFALYGLFCFLSLLFVYFLVPETKKITLERIEANLRAEKSSRDLGC